MINSGIAIAVSLAIFGALYATGLITSFELAHPFWLQTASVLACLIGVAFSAILLFLRQRNPLVAWRIAFVVGIIFPIALFATWRAGNIFVNSTEFEPLAGQIWHKGYHVLIASGLAISAYFIRRLLPN